MPEWEENTHNAPTGGAKKEFDMEVRYNEHSLTTATALELVASNNAPLRELKWRPVPQGDAVRLLVASPYSGVYVSAATDGGLGRELACIKPDLWPLTIDGMTAHTRASRGDSVAKKLPPSPGVTLDIIGRQGMQDMLASKFGESWLCRTLKLRMQRSLFCYTEYALFFSDKPLSIMVSLSGGLGSTLMRIHGNNEITIEEAVGSIEKERAGNVEKFTLALEMLIDVSGDPGYPEITGDTSILDLTDLNPDASEKANLVVSLAYRLVSMDRKHGFCDVGGTLDCYIEGAS